MIRTGMSRALLALGMAAALSARGAISADENEWTLENDAITATFRLTSAGLSVASLADNATGRSFAPAAESTATINGSTSILGAASGNWILQDVAREESESGQQIAFTFRSQRSPVVATRSFACYRGSPVLETWTTFRVTSSATVTISNINLWQITVPATLLQYSFGLRGDSAARGVDEAFSLQTASLGAGQELTLEEQNRSTEQFLPMIGADMPEDEFFGGIMWSGSWQLRAQGPGTARCALPRACRACRPPR